MPNPSRGASLTAAAAGTRSESPKRKHTEAMTIRERVPALDVVVPDLASDGDGHYYSEAKCDSPRSKVAERLEALEINHTDDDADADAPRKRVKTAELMRGEKLTEFDATPEQPPRLRFDLGLKEQGAAREIAETPGCRAEVARSPAPSPLARQAEPSMTVNVSPIVRISPKRMRSPPPPMASTSPSRSTTSGLGTSPNSSQEPSDASGMTWQESEITGHEIHRSLGDDGEGINGIGFRPTPAIAQARSQKRKHQLSEWRAREAKEARQRRFEKRQGCGVDVSGGDESQRRIVRFEEFG